MVQLALPRDIVQDIVRTRAVRRPSGCSELRRGHGPLNYTTSTRRFSDVHTSGAGSPPSDTPPELKKASEGGESRLGSGAERGLGESGEGGECV